MVSQSVCDLCVYQSASYMHGTALENMHDAFGSLQIVQVTLTASFKVSLMTLKDLPLLVIAYQDHLSSSIN